jgi:uncharacterized heparinase superfamily protein
LKSRAKAGWWTVHISEIEGLSSVRIEEPDFRELLESATQIKHIRAQASELEKESAERAREYAHWLVDHGVPVRDIAALLEISPQRVSQLANS